MAHSFTENREIILKAIKEHNPKRILDVGIGAGDYGVLIKKELPGVILSGLDIWTEYENVQWDKYDEIFIDDMRSFIFPHQDLTLFIDSLEHINKDEAWEVLKKVPNPILLSIPLNYKQPEKLDKYDKHLSEWSIEDFKDFDYKDYSNEKSLILLLYGFNSCPCLGGL